VTQIFILSGTSWTVPADWTSSNNSVETIGAGGGGETASLSYAGSGGGGGAYSKITNLSLNGGNTIAIQVGGGGLSGAAGGDTWFNGTSISTSSVSAQAGGGGADNSGGSGGASVSGIGETKFSGGNGAALGGPDPWTGAGGGGGAGPQGAGGDGGSPSNQAVAGAGGGGGNGNGTAGGNGDSVTGNGGSGGNGNSGTGGGASDTGSGAGNATTGTGGGGGGGKYATSDDGGNGATGSEFDSLHGSGGGGGGGGGRDFGATEGAGSGGSGANYGGGGGGGGYPRNGATFGGGGVGGQGIIVVTYTPAVSFMITAESRNVLEYDTVCRKDALYAIEFGQSARSDGGLPIEGRGGVRCNTEAPIDFRCVAFRSSWIPIQWAGSAAVIVNALFQLEAAASLRRDTLALDEITAGTSRKAIGPTEWLATEAIGAEVAVEHLGRCRVDPALLSESRILLARDLQLRLEFLAAPGDEALLALESLTSGISISADCPFYWEWADPPSLLLVAGERLLRSPGRVRILAGPDSIHPLRGQ